LKRSTSNLGFAEWEVNCLMIRSGPRVRPGSIRNFSSDSRKILILMSLVDGYTLRWPQNIDSPRLIRKILPNKELESNLKRLEICKLLIPLELTEKRCFKHAQNIDLQ
jgi:hypothetical protein